jgi:hypothetical protein
LLSSVDYDDLAAVDDGYLSVLFAVLMMVVMMVVLSYNIPGSG